MTGEELRELRRSLGLQLDWCAEHVGRVAVRTWRFWETGRGGKPVPIPSDVQQRILAVQKALEAALAD